MRGGIDRALMHDAVAILNRVQRYKKYLEYANFLPFYLRNSKKSSTFGTPLPLLGRVPSESTFASCSPYVRGKAFFCKRRTVVLTYKATGQLSVSKLPISTCCLYTRDEIASFAKKMPFPLRMSNFCSTFAAEIRNIILHAVYFCPHSHAHRGADEGSAL